MLFLSKLTRAFLPALALADGQNHHLKRQECSAGSAYFPQCGTCVGFNLPKIFPSGLRLIATFLAVREPRTSRLLPSALRPCSGRMGLPRFPARRSCWHTFSECVVSDKPGPSAIHGRDQLKHRRRRLIRNMWHRRGALRHRVHVHRGRVLPKWARQLRPRR